MLRPALLLLLFMSCESSIAQCDSAEVREWLRTMSYDTVHRGYFSRKTHKQSFIKFLNDSTFSYSYHDTVTHRYSYRYYLGYRLQNYNYNMGDTFVSIRYYDGSCAVRYHVVELWNDSLSTEDEGGTVYDYRHDEWYNEEGKKTYEETQTTFMRKEKRYARTVCIDYTKVIHRRKVYVHEQTKGKN